MARAFRWRLSLLLCVAFAAGLRGADVESSLLGQQLAADARDGVLSQFDLPSACLVAGGVTDPSELAIAQQRMVEVSGSISLLFKPNLTLEERTEAIFQRLHANLLTGKYEKHATDLRRTLDSGDYNCLSALVLYVELCRRAGVRLEIWSQPGHVYCVLPGNRPLRIEPASRDWNAAPQTLLAAPADIDRAPRRIAPIELAGKFAYNRGVELLERQQFAAGIESLRLACQLDPRDPDAQANLLAGLNNWALALIEQDQPAAARALIVRGLAIDPAFPPLVANDEYVRKLIAAPR